MMFYFYLNKSIMVVDIAFLRRRIVATIRCSFLNVENLKYFVASFLQFHN